MHPPSPAPAYRLTLNHPHRWRRVKTLIVGFTTVVSGCSADLVAPLAPRTRITGTVKAPQLQMGLSTQGFLAEEVPAGGATIVARTVDGKAVSGEVKTDAQGQFVLADIPPDRQLFLEARIAGSGDRTLKLSGYVKPGTGATIRDLSTVSSLVAAKLQTLSPARLAVVRTDDVIRLELTLSTEISVADIPDLSSPEGLAATFDALSTRYGTIASSFGAVSGAITTAAVTVGNASP